MPSRLALVRAKILEAQRAKMVANAAAATATAAQPTVGGVPLVSIPIPTTASSNPVYVLSAMAFVEAAPVYRAVPTTIKDAKANKVDTITIEAGKVYKLLSTQRYGADNTLVFSPLMIVDRSTGAIKQYEVCVGKNTNLPPDASAEIVSTDLDFFFGDFTL